MLFLGRYRDGRPTAISQPHHVGSTRTCTVATPLSANPMSGLASGNRCSRKLGFRFWGFSETRQLHLWMKDAGVLSGAPAFIVGGGLGYFGGSWRVWRTLQNTTPANSKSRRTTAPISSASPSGPMPSAAPLETPLSRAVAIVKKPRSLPWVVGRSRPHIHIYPPGKPSQHPGLQPAGVLALGAPAFTMPCRFGCTPPSHSGPFLFYFAWQLPRVSLPLGAFL